MYSLRPATQTDLEPMMAIGHEGLRPYVEAARGWDQEAEEAGFREHFDPDQISIIQLDGSDIGYIKTEDLDDHLLVDGIYIHRDARSKGIGAQVLKDLIASAKKPLRLWVFKTNPAADLYRRLGFTIVGGDDHRFAMQHDLEA